MPGERTINSIKKKRNTTATDFCYEKVTFVWVVVGRESSIWSNFFSRIQLTTFSSNRKRIRNYWVKWLAFVPMKLNFNCEKLRRKFASVQIESFDAFLTTAFASNALCFVHMSLSSGKAIFTGQINRWHDSLTSKCVQIIILPVKVIPHTYIASHTTNSRFGSALCEKFNFVKCSTKTILSCLMCINEASNHLSRLPHHKKNCQITCAGWFSQLFYYDCVLELKTMALPSAIEQKSHILSPPGISWYM